MRTLIIEFRDGGHYLEYLSHLLKKVENEFLYEKYLFYVSPILRVQLKKYKYLENKCLFYISDDVYSKYSKLKNRQRSKFIFEQITKIKLKQEFNHVIFLNLNLILRTWILFFPYRKLQFSFSGIFLNSPFRIRSKEKRSLKLYKREIALRLISLNKNCTGVFLLNDYKGVEFYQNWSSKIRYIPDPVSITEPSKIDIYEFHNLSREYISILHIGVLGMYKGTRQIIKAAEEMDEQLKNKVRFLFVGKHSSKINELVLKNNAIQKFNQILSRNEFISPGDFSAYIRQSHIVVIANMNVEASSGIINHCLANQKVIVAPNDGYYKEILEYYGGAILFDKKIPLYKAIEEAVRNYDMYQIQAMSFDSKEFVNLHSEQRFATICLQ